MSDPFMDQFAATFTPQAVAIHGRTVTYKPNGEGGKSIQAVLVAGSRKFELGEEDVSMDHEECAVLVSSRNNTEGHVDPAQIGNLSNLRCDQIVGIFGDEDTWYVLEIEEDGREGLGMHKLVLSSVENVFG